MEPTETGSEMETEIGNESVKKPGYFKQLSFTGQLTRFIIYLSAAVPAIIFIVLALLGLAGVISPVEIPSGDGVIIIGAWYDFLVFAVLIFTGVYGIYEFTRLRRVRKIDARFPDFVRDLAESRRAGMTFTKAIMYSSKGNYGVLTPEIQKIARQISWGSSVDNALNVFAKRVNTKLIRRTVSLIIEASRSGGNVADVLDAASKDAREIKLIESERRANMMSYVAIIYVGLFVFILIVVVLSKSLLPSMLSEEVKSVGGGAVGLGGGGITQGAATAMFFTACMIQAAGMGIVTGVFEEGDMISGIKHSFIMLLCTWIIFKFIITGI